MRCVWARGDRTWSEERESSLKAVLIKVAQDRLLLFSDLFESTQDHKQETCITFRDLARVPLHGGLLTAISSHRGAYCHGRRESTGQR